MMTVSVCSPSLPQLSPGTQLKLRIKCSDGFGAVRICCNRIKPIDLGLKLQPIVGTSRKQSFCVALNATCSAYGQTQTVTREAPTITQAPVHSKDKSQQLDDGGFGFPPNSPLGGGEGNRLGGGGGGGGGPGGHWSGGFLLFIFLAYLADIGSEEDYREKKVKMEIIICN